MTAIEYRDIDVKSSELETGLSLSDESFEKDFKVVMSKPSSSIRRIRNELNSLSWQPRSLLWRRSFGRPGSVPLDVIAERKLQWPFIADVCGLFLHLPKIVNVSGNIGAKERRVQRIGPWIRRELQAILGDPGPSVIVHVASSLFIASLENNISVHSEQLNVEDESIAPLHRFLDDRTNYIRNLFSYLNNPNLEGVNFAIVASLGFLIISICYLGVNLLGIGLHSYGMTIVISYVLNPG
ncbi:cytochrome c biogenesis protein ccsa [Quercus suber]|uniref:Cytochrome c biogenesis protein ccsa n=1 Tax=Quercus suber TaxID=58331 RepID=A0AAW0LBD1_QUESU